MNINFIQLIIFIIPLSLIFKGLYYFIISTSKADSKIRLYSVIKTNDNLDFFIKNRFMAKSYIFIGIITTLFFTIYNIAYPTYNNKKLLYIFLIVFLIDILTDALGKIKCQINDYDKVNSKINEKEDGNHNE